MSYKNPSSIPKCPEELRAHSADQLSLLATLLRQELISSVTRSGGHFAPSLGVVELSIALHYCFDTPRDQIVWDVGHQGYVHKMLTGRRDRLSTLRSRNGLSGYLKRTESPFDCFGAGHAGTSISAALGLQCALQRRRMKQYVVAVIGDGALTAGMAYEALNHAGALGLDNFIVVLNDNGMSIGPNVGALSERKTLLGFFSSLGCTYIGPKDGHCFSTLLNVFTTAKELPGPVVVHLKTTKGKGDPEAERDPVTFHAVKTPQLASTKTLSPTYSEVFGQTLCHIATADQRVVAISAAMKDGTGLRAFAEAHPEAFFDVGIAEQHAVTFAAGLACQGLRPVVAIYSSFLQRGFDQVVHDVCIQNLPVVFALDRSGLVGNDGETHQGVFDISYLRTLPNLVIMSPKDEIELQHMLYTALKHPGPSAIRYPRGAAQGLPLDNDHHLLPIGKAQVLADGDDALLIAFGPQVADAQEIRRRLIQEFDIELAVVNARFAKPLDQPLLQSLALRYKTIFTLEDHARAGGFGSAVLEHLSDEGISCRVVRFGVQDRFVGHATQAQQRAENCCDPESIVQSIAAICPKRTRASKSTLYVEFREGINGIKQVA